MPSLIQSDFNPKIPTCQQLEHVDKKILNVKQNTESRQVTKCRFKIEKKIGEIKKNKAIYII